MNAIGIVFTAVTSVFLLTVPRRSAAIPLLIGAAYMTRGQVLEIGPASFTVMRILVVVGICRVLIKGERIANGIGRVDRTLIFWAAFLIGSSVFHTQAWVTRIGIVWSDLGCYFLFRVFIQDWEDVRHIFKVLCVILVPIAVLMLLEKYSGRNFFAALGGVDAMSAIRDGHVRAQGAFTHAILAGTVGATCVPMALYLWKSHRKHALLGLFSGGGIVFATSSSGPLMMVLAIFFGLVLWKIRSAVRAIRWLALLGIIFLDMVMIDPVYYLMARIDLGGGSTGYHRARLIESSIEHLGDWWLVGTDYTRHWMASGIHANATHADITNHFLAMGVMGGLPLMLLWVMVLVAAFGVVGTALRKNRHAPVEHRFLIWTLGGILFGHVVNFFGISLFDQSATYLYLVLAGIGAVEGAKLVSDTTSQLIGRHPRTESRSVPRARTIGRRNGLGFS